MEQTGPSHAPHSEAGASERTFNLYEVPLRSLPNLDHLIGKPVDGGGHA